MEAKLFKRDAVLVLNPRGTKEAFKTILKKRKDLNVASSILNLSVAVGHLMRTYQDYITPGVQIKDAHRARGKEALGEVLQHAAATAKLIKVKVPSANRKIKPKHTPTQLLVEIQRTSGEILSTLVAPLNSYKVVPLEGDALTKAQEAYAKRVEAAKKKWEEAPAETVKKVKDAEGKETEVKVAKGEFKAPKTPDYTKIVAEPVKESALTIQMSNFFNLVYEFCWSVCVVNPAVPAEHVIADIFEEHIKKLAPSYPEGFFTPPPKKPAPAGLKPPTKKAKKTEDTPAETAKAPVA